ncbi:TetR/AcrR family transcriptional regulator [Nocardia arizonensis]|uniref:TetR/AcrR family transcriptional regulator n=1 Tax=Nocardia arizonensis TaxID=1141647 RepID=UPI0006CFBBC8|nr:TetR/AcrR family transcriptional regulator [Nocardia arizonensis]
MSTAESAGPGDGRLRRGARSRGIITRHAVDIASVDGLGGISFGRLADELEISKAGIQTLFRTKENLQLATARTAGEVFVDEVIEPAVNAPEGMARLRALIDRWIDYAERPLFPGGCFWSANLPEFDSHPGPIRDLLLLQHRAWLATLARQLRASSVEPVAGSTEIDARVFQIDALLKGANIALRLGADDAVPLLRTALAALVP